MRDTRTPRRLPQNYKRLKKEENIARLCLKEQRMNFIIKSVNDTGKYTSDEIGMKKK